jgi:hypothetical protein
MSAQECLPRDLTLTAVDEGVNPEILGTCTFPELLKA